MSFSDDTLKSEEPSRDPQDSSALEGGLPDGFTPLEVPPGEPAARRRHRPRRYLVTPNADERSALVENLARRAFPSFEFFLFALLCGAFLGAGFILDSEALLLLGILLAPLLTPWVGVVLGAMTGSWRFFFQTLIALLAAAALVFLTGGLAGLAARIWLPLPLVQADIAAHLWWPNLVVLALGALMMVYSFARSQDKPILPSVMLSYGLLLPLSAAGFGLGSGAPHLWPNGALVCLVHLALITLLGGLVLAVLRFKPAGFLGGVLTGLVAVLCLAALVTLTGLGDLILGIGRPPIVRKPTPTAAVLVLPSLTPSPRPSATEAAPTQTPAPLASPTVSPTPTPKATAAYALITASSGGGAIVRNEPGGVPVTTLLNGVLVEVLPDIQSYGGFNYVHIRTMQGIDGWVLQSVLTAATPSPTPTLTLTPTH
jgi:hypothetical protein